MNIRDDFTQHTKDVLSRRVGGRCSNPGCRQPTHGPTSDAGRSINVGFAAHITAAAPGGDRYDKTKTPESRKAAENGIWLCGSCAKLIDSDELRYSVELLQKWKIQAEKEALEGIEGPPRSAQENNSGFQKIESLMPDLLSEMRDDLGNDPLSREFIVMRRSQSYWPDGQEDVLVYYYDDHQNLDNKIRVLENYGLIQDITQTNVGRFLISEKLADYLSRPINQSSHQEITSGHVIRAGGKVTIGQEATPTVVPPWLQRSGCPQFKMAPGIQPSQGEIGGDMRIFGAAPLPNSIEVKWEGVGIDMDWTVPTPTGVRGNEQLAFHMGWVGFQPGDAEEMQVKFRLRFWWDNQQHEAAWIWYLVPHASKQGVWEWNYQKGSGTHQPKIQDTQ